jgi:RNA recognition motif-containing protein
MTKWRHESEKYEINPRKLIETKTLEVENISEETTPKDLHTLFSRYGSVLSVAIEAGYESAFFEDRDPESDEAVESDKVIGPEKVIGRVTMRVDDARIADKNLHGRRWRGQKLRLTLQRDSWGTMPNFDE